MPYGYQYTGNPGVNNGGSTNWDDWANAVPVVGTGLNFLTSLIPSDTQRQELSGIEYTAPGATKMYNQIHPMLQELLAGKGSSFLNQYFNQAQSNLYGQMQRDAGGAGNIFAAQAINSGTNPQTAYNLARGRISNQYAGAFGNLNAERARASQSFLNQLLGLEQGLIGMGANSAALGSGMQKDLQNSLVGFLDKPNFGIDELRSKYAQYQSQYGG